MAHDHENDKKASDAKNEERRPSLTERARAWFPDLRTKHQEAVDKQTLEDDLAIERKSIEEDEQMKEAKATEQQRK